MSERKVLNKYYPPDFDPSKIPRLKREKNRQFTIRLMAPFNMRCKTCGEYIYRGKKFNARKEDVIGSMYLGIQIYRFYIKCTKCLAEITFLTDPENQDYAMENGAMRNFESLRLAEKQAETEAKAKKDEEENNPMKILENRTRDSRREMAVLETLEDLRELNTANANVDTDILLNTEEVMKKQVEDQEREEDEEEIRRIFGTKRAIPSSIEEIVGEVLDAKTLKQKYAEEEEMKNLAKKQKIEDEMDAFSSISKKTKSDVVYNSISKAVHTLVKPQVAASQAPTSLAKQLARSNVAIIIKKKPEPEVKKEPAVNAEPVKASTSAAVLSSKPVVNSLGCLAGAYGSDEDSEEDNE